MERIDVGLPVVGKTIGEIQDEPRIESLVFIRRGPRQRAERDVGRIEVNRIDEIARLGARSEGEEFIRRGVEAVQAIAELVVRLDGEKTKGGIVNPFELYAAIGARDLSAIKSWEAQVPLDGVSCGHERCFIRCGAGADGIFHIMAKVDVSRISGSVGSSVQHGGAEHKALRAATAAQGGKDFALESGYWHRRAASWKATRSPCRRSPAMMMGSVSAVTSNSGESDQKQRVR